MKQLSTLVPNEDDSLCRAKHLLFAGFDLCPLETAVYAAWFEGVEYLLQKGADASHALRGGILRSAMPNERGLVTSDRRRRLVELVLRDDLPNAIPFRINPYDENFHQTSPFAIEGMDDVILKETYNRREKLRSIWVREGLPGTISPIPTFDKPLDTAAPDVFDILRSRHIKMPQALDPGTVSIWHCRDWQSSFGRAARDKWFAYGFVDIDSRGCHGKTPLETIMNEWWRCPLKADLDYALWLYRKGACPVFGQDEPNGCPNMLFYFAQTCTPDNKPSAKYIALLSSCSRLATDSCSCYCSEAGCLPGVGTFITNWKTRTPWVTHGIDSLLENNFARLTSWHSIIALTESELHHYTESWMRREVFQLLAMTHTCAVWKESDLRITPTSDVAEDIQISEGLQLILLEVFMESFRAEGLSGLLYEDFPVLPGRYSEWLAKLDSIFSAVGQPSWRIMAWDSLSITWDDVLDKRGLEDPTSRTGPSTSRTAQGNYTPKQSALNLPGAWPNDDYSEPVLKSATHPESESSAGLSRDIETGADGSGLDEKLTSTSGFLAWSSRRQAVRSREFMEATCLAFSDILSEDILSDAKEAFMEELEKGARVLSRQTGLFSDK